STITESLSLAAIPQEIRDLCRRADISSKSLLLQIVRQPTDDEMRRLVEQISVGGLTRDEARSVRKGKAKRDEGFRLKYKSKNQSWSLLIQFKKARVEKDELRSALMEALDHIDESA